MLASARTFKYLFGHFKLKFYCCFNVVYYRVKYAVGELVGVHRFKSALCYMLVRFCSLRNLPYLINRSLFRLLGCSEVSDLQFVHNVMGLMPAEVVIDAMLA